MDAGTASPHAMDSSRALAALVAVSFVVAATPSIAQSLSLTQRIELPSVQGRIDHMDIDPDGKRLFVAALGADSVEVVDLPAGRRVWRIEHLHEPQGVAYLATAHRLFVANGSSGDVQVFSEGKPPVAASAKNLDDADNLRIDAAAMQLYVGYGNALAVLDPATLQVVKRIELSGHPEAFELERRGTRLYVNVPSAGHVAVIDRSTGKVSATWDLGAASRNFPMALDERSHRLFVATRQPARMLVYDTITGKRTSELAICGDADDLFHDEQRQQLYAVCGEGAVDIIRQRDPDHYELARRVQTSTGARTGLFVPRLSTLFVAVPSRGGSSAEIRAYRVE